MKIVRGLALEFPEPPEAVRERLGPVLARFGFQPREGTTFRRGGTLLGSLSDRVERWPAQLLCLATPRAYGTRLECVLEVDTRWHLVGRLDQRLVEVELELLERSLGGHEIPPPAEVLDLLRRPVRRAALVNAVLAAGLVTVVGGLTGLALWMSVLAGSAVGLLDLVVVHAFADLVLDGDRAQRVLLAGAEDAREPTHAPRSGS